jgi:serine/threonine-protein kinase
MPMPPLATQAKLDDLNDRVGNLRPGLRVGRYRLLGLLGVGGMAHVWAATPEGGGGLARTVALKVVRPELVEDDEYCRLFIDEATIAASIHHPNVAETYELGRHGKLLFMAMEWVVGESLAALLRVKGSLVPIDLKVAVRILADACGGLHAAHRTLGQDGKPLNVVHRDVSPPNVLVSLHGQVKVSDFGVAKARHQLHERTRTGELKGKYGYLAPEQIAGRGVDRRVDVYALGCVLYVATLGLRPFGAGPQALSKILSGTFKRPCELKPDYPPELQAIVLRALEPRPDNRYQTAEEMKQALELWLLDRGHVASASDIAETVCERMPPKAIRRLEDLRSMNKIKPDLAYGLLMQGPDEDAATPTATSGLVSQPEGLRPKGGSDDPTVRAVPAHLVEDTATTLPDLCPTPSKAHAKRAEVPLPSRKSGDADRVAQTASSERVPASKPVLSRRGKLPQVLVAAVVIALVLSLWVLLR